MANPDRTPGGGASAEDLRKRDLVVRGLDGDEEALREILKGDEIIFVEQPEKGKTIADDGVIVSTSRLRYKIK